MGKSLTRSPLSLLILEGSFEMESQINWHASLLTLMMMIEFGREVPWVK